MTSATLTLAALEALLFVCAWLLAGRRLPVALLGLVAATAPLEVYRTPMLGVNLSLFRLSLLLTVIVLLTGRYGREARELVRDGVFWCYLSLAAVMSISLLSVSDNSDLGFRVFSQVAIGCLAIVAVGALVRRVNDMSVVATTLVIATGLPILTACWQAVAYSTGSDPTLPFLDALPAALGLENSRVLSYVGSALRVKSTFADPNHLGAYAALTLGPCLGLFAYGVRHRSGPIAYSAAAMSLGLLCLVFASGSRSAWLAVAICTVALSAVLGVPAVRRLRGRTKTFTIAAAVSVCLLGALVAQPVIERRLSDDSANTVSNRSHGTTLRLAMDDFGRFPVFGIGIADFGPQLNQGIKTSGAHSAYLTVAAELGLIGLSSLLLGLALTGVLLFRGIARSEQGSRDLWIGFASGYAGFVVASGLYDLWWDDFHWVFIACVVGLGGALVLPSRRDDPALDLPQPADLTEDTSQPRVKSAPVVADMPRASTTTNAG